MMTADKIKELITKGLTCEHIEVRGDDGRHFEALVVSSEFEGLNMLAQHRKVYETLGDRMEKDEIHALSLKTYKASEWGKA